MCTKLTADTQVDLSKEERISTQWANRSQSCRPRSCKSCKRTLIVSIHLPMEGDSLCPKCDIGGNGQS